MTTVHTLASGSSGNALLLSCGESYILLDAGISCRRITAALRELGLELGSLTAILITHTHADHISGLQTLLKRCAAPVFTTERAARELSWRLPGAETRLDALDFGIPQSIGEFAVTAFPTSHDAPGSCGFRLDAAGGAVGVLTDTDCRRQSLVAFIAFVTFLSMIYGDRVVVEKTECVADDGGALDNRNDIGYAVVVLQYIDNGL